MLWSLVVVLGTLSMSLQRGSVAAGERYALIVGVHQYDKNELRSLPYAESDAVAVAERLKALGFRRVVLMTQTLGAKEARFLPTAANLRDAVDGFLDPKKWEDDDSAVIVLSGHGVQFKGQDVSYFCPMDANLGKQATLIDINDIYRRMEKCPAAFKLLIADCCRNDPQSDFSRARAEVDLDSVTRPQRVKPPGGVAAFFSCSAGEKAFESPELRQGVFTHFLLEGLSDPKTDLDRDGKVDLDELVRFTRRNVTDYVSDQFGESTIQVPELVGRTRGLVPIVELAKTTSRPAMPPLSGNPPPKLQPDAPKIITSKATGMKLLLIPAGEYLRLFRF
ncbi:MAG: caspase family protein [Planctomycetaceae bacterium]|nr:caspase family protein [Planctomycetaceae bacterium]